MLATADVVIGTTVVAESPERFGTNIEQIIEYPMLNNFTFGSSFEPQILRMKGTATDGGANFIVNDQNERTWFYDTISDGFFDGATVRVYRVVNDQVQLFRTSTVAEYLASDPAAGGNGFQINLSDMGDPIEAGDIYFLDLVLENPPYDSLADRIIPYATPWPAFGDGTRERDSSTAPPVVGGQQSLRLDGTGPGEVRIAQFTFSPPSGALPQLVPARTYRMDVWMRQEGLASGEVEFRMDSLYSSVQHTFTGVDGDWQQYGFEFSIDDQLVEAGRPCEALWCSRDQGRSGSITSTFTIRRIRRSACCRNPSMP